MRSRSSRIHANRGLTLIELMVTFSLLVVLMALAAPSFQSQIAASQLSSATNELMSTLMRSRAESMRLGIRVTVCKTAGSATQCSNATTSGWEQGWLVVHDPTRSTNATVDSGETVTFVVSPLSADLKVEGTADVAKYVSFAATGQSRLMGGGSQAGRIRVCSTSRSLRDDNRARELVLTSTGRIIVEKPSSVTSDCPAPA